VCTFWCKIFKKSGKNWKSQGILLENLLVKYQGKNIFVIVNKVLFSFNVGQYKIFIDFFKLNFRR
jgi:hypothetical protein